MTEPSTTYRVTLDVAGALAGSDICPGCGGPCLEPGPEEGADLRCRDCGAQWRDELGRLWRVEDREGGG